MMPRIDSNTTRAWVRISSATSCPVFGSRAVMPAVKMTLPNFTPCEMGKRDTDALSVRITSRRVAISPPWWRGQAAQAALPGRIVEAGEQRDHVLPRVDRDEVTSGGNETGVRRADLGQRVAVQVLDRGEERARLNRVAQTDGEPQPPAGRCGQVAPSVKLGRGIGRRRAGQDAQMLEQASQVLEIRGPVVDVRDTVATDLGLDTRDAERVRHRHEGTLRPTAGTQPAEPRGDR